MSTLAARGAIAEMATLCWPALGTTAVVRAPRRHLSTAYRAAAGVVRQVDLLASRFHTDSELARLNARAGEWTSISPGLVGLVRHGIWAAEVSDGAVDPTLANDLRDLGYDRDFSQLHTVDTAWPLRQAPGVDTADRGRPWRGIELREDLGMIRLPREVGLDLGATAKGRAADLAAAAAHHASGGPVLISFGGDVSVAGPAPQDGWTVGIADDHRTDSTACDEAVTIHSGGLATSSLLVRRWWHDGEPVHHVLDPRTGRPVIPHWALVSVTAATCADANIAATAATVLGAQAPRWLESHGLPARLVAADGTVARLAGWPA